MVICTSITQSYLEKSKPFFDSVNKHFDGKKICFCIGFTAEIEGWETVTVNELECKWRPKNRKDYYSLQHGEFIKHYKFDPDEMIALMDSDVILQRKFDLDFPATDGICVTRCSTPSIALRDVVKNIGFKGRTSRFYSKYGIEHQREFCAAFIMAKAKTWSNIHLYTSRSYGMLEGFTHHAAWQLLINVALINKVKSFILPEFIMNAEWYKGMGAVNEDWVLKVGEETVYFNHTKFNGNWKY